MTKAIRSARGEAVNFELLAIKSQLASVPAPKQVEERKSAIEEREGLKAPSSAAVDELLKVAQDAVEVSAKAPKRK